MRTISGARILTAFSWLAVLVCAPLAGIADDEAPMLPALEVAAPAPGETVRNQETHTPADVGDLIEAGRALWEEFAPEEIKAEYDFPAVEDVRLFLAALESDLAEGTPARLASYEVEAERALIVLRKFEGGDVLADWLEPRLDLLRAARQMEQSSAPAATAARMHRPQYTRGYWDRVLANRKPPRRAGDYVPQLKEIFRDAGVPQEWVWIAEVESAMNPEATSPVGARGLFQFMPATAARFGLESGLFSDDRTDPGKSARAAAAYLHVLHRRFKSWPLALAAYNAGEGRVGRALAAEKVTTFEAVSHRLPPETRMYVPKVLATVAMRESIDPEMLPAPVRIVAASAALPVPVIDPAAATLESR